jgi:methionine-rich copper-binding protein CopC
MFRLARRLLPALALALTLILPGLASAHAEYVSSTPAANSSIATAPATVTIIFSEELTIDTKISVVDASGKSVDKGDTRLDTNDAERRRAIVSLQSGLGTGVYTVSWKSSSTDGHTDQGSFSFSVGAATSAPAAAGRLPATGAADNLAPVALLLAAALLISAGIALRGPAARA